jgi:hypothetical protein
MQEVVAELMIELMVLDTEGQQLVQVAQVVVVLVVVVKATGKHLLHLELAQPGQQIPVVVAAVDRTFLLAQQEEPAAMADLVLLLFLIQIIHKEAMEEQLHHTPMAEQHTGYIRTPHLELILHNLTINILYELSKFPN